MFDDDTEEMLRRVIAREADPTRYVVMGGPRGLYLNAESGCYGDAAYATRFKDREVADAVAKALSGDHTVLRTTKTVRESHKWKTRW